MQKELTIYLKSGIKKLELHYPLLLIASLKQIKMFSEFDMWIIPINRHAHWRMMVYNFTVLTFSVYVL